MRSVEKTSKPAILIEHEITWTDELLTYIKEGKQVPEHLKSKYRHKEIKEQLIKETHNKCVYCECKITHIDHGDVEHIVPKSKVHEKTFSWDNLTISCSKCNGYKSDYYDTTLPLLNPYIDEPEKKISFFGPIPIPKYGDPSSELTIKKLKLDRSELIERRIEHLKMLHPLILQFQRANNKELKRLILQDIIEMTKISKEFSLMTQCFIQNILSDAIVPVAN